MAESIKIEVSDGHIKTPLFRGGRSTYSGAIHHSRSDGKYQRSDLLTNGRGFFLLPKSVNAGDIIELTSALGRIGGSLVFKVEQTGKSELSGKLYSTVESAKKAGSSKKAAPKNAEKKATKKKSK